ncbi:hypothetical protein DMA15_12585 [Streptomyces sp. WAC 01529]|uniref:hypothetical protein n=1 Tax=Streptomyces sp. WAC 01529 TaxID=2203205 RepID=UPI000F6F9CAE|nr:hypothetical protein [Streptomyces sp. WAC 01529]AZM53319.1 hypothetical protein DMA15_12585 [Streptomyces sp. WAC 01529]
MTIELVNTDGRIWSSTHSGFVFHAFRRTEDGKPVALCRKNVRPRSFTTMYEEWSTAEFADGTHGGRCERCVAKLAEVAEVAEVAETSTPAGEDEPLPQAVQNAAPGDFVVLPDADTTGRVIVWRDREHAGVINDEGANMTRGRYAAWSPRAERRDGVVGFFATVDEAAAAIKALWPPRPARTTPTCRTRSHRPSWRVVVRRANYSAFNGGRRTPSPYSLLRCGDCGGAWRTKAAYVAETPDAT